MVKIPANLTSPKWSAPYGYLFASSDDKGQYKSKVCDCLLGKKNRFSKEAILRCPHCLKSLERIKERTD